MTKIKLFCGNTKLQIEALQERVRKALENNEEIEITTNSDLEVLVIINTVLECLKREDGAIKQEDIDNVLDINVITEDGRVVKGRVTLEGLEPDVWSCINSELLSKFVELIQYIE